MTRLLADVVLVAVTDRLPEGAPGWPVRAVLASDCPAGGLPGAYLCGRGAELQAVLAGWQEPLLGVLADSESSAEAQQAPFREAVPALEAGFTPEAWEALVCSICSRHLETMQHMILQAARKYPDRPALIYEDREWTFQQMLSKASSLRDHLIAEGLRPGPNQEPVAVLMQPSDYCSISYLALLMSRFTIHVLEKGVTGRNLRIAACKSQACLCDSTDAPDPPLDMRTIFVDRLDLDASLPLSGIRVEGELDDVAFIEYTSGSTGRPKSVATQQFRISHWGRWHQYHYPQGDARVAYNLFFIWYWQISLQQGSTCVITPTRENLDIQALMKTCERHRVAWINCLTPGLLSALLHVSTELPKDLRVMYCGGEALPMDTARQWLKRWPEVELINNYALTEVAADMAFCHMTPEVIAMDERFAPISNGIICWNNRYEAVNDELVIAGWNVAPGYLPPTESEAFTLSPDGRNHVYRTGDRCRVVDKMVFLAGRMDNVVKVRGFRVDTAGMEALLIACQAVEDVVVLAWRDALWGLVVTKDLPAVKLFAQENSSQAHLIIWRAVAVLPYTKSGKRDRQAAVLQLQEKEDAPVELSESNNMEHRVAAAWKEVLGRAIGREETFLEAGGHSLMAMKLAKLLDVSPAEIFAHPTIAALSAKLSKVGEAVAPRIQAAVTDGGAQMAVVGMAGRFPGADSVGELWEALEAGRVLTSAVPGAGPLHVQRKGIVADLGLDCAFWKMPKEQAAGIDPVQRVLLEAAYEALADAGLDPFKVSGRVGVVLCGGSLNHYAAEQLGDNLEESRTERPDEYFGLEVGLDKDYVATSISFRLNLHGPSEVVQTACSSGLVAIVRAVQMLRLGICDYVLCGGGSFSPDGPVRVVDGLIWSPDGVCRPYAEGASGTVNSDGAGLVLLTRLDAALERGQRVYATVRGAATNNDGSRKAGYSAPSHQGQVEVLKLAHADAGISSFDIDYVEGHGTGTKLGDPLEVHALTEVLSEGAPPGSTRTVMLGSVKGNIGHMNTAAGVPGFIKASLMLYHQRMVPSMHAPNPSKFIRWEQTPLRLATEAADWKGRVAAVSSFGVGGTNAHVVLGAAPPVDSTPLPRFPAHEWSRDTLVAERKAWAKRVAASSSSAKISGRKPVSRSVAPTSSVAARSEGSDSLEGLFYETAYEQVEVSCLHLREAAVILDGESSSKMPGGLPENFVLASPSRALEAARAMGGTLIFLGESDLEPGEDDTTQEELLASCMSLLSALAREAKGELEIFFVLKANLRYSALWGLLRAAAHEHPELRLRRMLREGDGVTMLLPALPCELNLRSEGAFAPRLRAVAPPAAVPLGAARNALVTGGLRGLGLQVGKWLLESGRASSLVLVGRNSAKGEAAEVVRSLQEKWPVEVRNCDVSNWAEVQQLPDDCDLVIHCAGNIKDGLLMNLTPEDASQVLRPKIRGSLHLKRHFPRSKLFAFSSSSGLIGPAGQSTYAAANTFVDALMPSIQWGGWGEVGMALDLGIDPLPGELFLPVAQGMECLGRVLDGPGLERHAQGQSPLCVLGADWEAYRQNATVFAPDEQLLAGIEVPAQPASSLGERCEGDSRGDGHVQRWTLILGAAGARWRGASTLWEVSQQHVVLGTTVFPATGFVSLALEAAASVLDVSLVQLSDVSFLRPLELSTTRRLTTTLVRSGAGGTLRFSSVPLPPAGQEEDQEEASKAASTLHCTCSFAAGNASVLAQQELEAKATQSQSLPAVPSIYARFAAAGYFYGPAFQGSGFAASASSASCKLPASKPANLAVQPGNLDVALQLASLLHPLGCRGAPQAIRRLVARSGTQLSTATGQLTAMGQLNFQALDASGKVGCSIEGLSMAALDAPATLQTRRCVWKPLATETRRGAWLAVGTEAQSLGLPGTVDREEESHEAVVMAVRASSLEDVLRCRREVSIQVAKKRCWLLALQDQGETFAEAAAAAAIEVGAHAIIGSASALSAVAEGLGHFTNDQRRQLLRAEDGGRLSAWSAEAAEVPAQVLASRGEPFVATTDPSKAAKGAQCRLTQPSCPEQGEVQILASLWALNFRDVLVAVGAISTEVAGKSLGIGGECYGKVTAVGAGVTSVAVGDEVVAVPPDGMGSFVITDARWVTRSPAGMSPEQAVAGTCVYATAWLGLHWMARIDKGDRVLVHSAAGGVGLAAVHLCLRAGCTVYCTASTPEKRALLLSLGVTAVFNSRNVADFEAGVRGATSNEGVDVVLNSLSGEAIPASLRLLRPFGRFVEIGKRDQYEDTRIGLSPFLNGLTYCTAHFDVLMLRQPDRCRKLLEEVWAALPELPHLPTKTFNMSELSGALEYFSKGVHVGKVLVAVDDCPVLPARPTAVAGPCGDTTTQALRAALGAEDAPGGVVCLPRLEDALLLGPQGLGSAQLVLTASAAVAAVAKVLCPDATSVLLPSWEVVGNIDDWLSLGGQLVASEEEAAGDLHGWLMEVIEDMAGEMALDETFEDAGLDSLSLISLARRLSSKVNKAVSVADLSDHPTPRQLLASFAGGPQPQLTRPKAVCLHGFRANQEAMAIQMGPLLSSCGFVEWIFVNSPHAARGPAAPKIRQDEAREWWGQDAGSFETGWMAPHFDGLEASLALVNSMKPLGVVGFSQGGGLATLVECKWLALFSPVLADGIRRRSEPSFVSYDATEDYVEQCIEVAGLFSSKQVHVHSAGHDVPRDAESIRLFAAFVAAQVQGAG